MPTEWRDHVRTPRSPNYVSVLRSEDSVEASKAISARVSRAVPIRQINSLATIGEQIGNYAAASARRCHVIPTLRLNRIEPAPAVDRVVSSSAQEGVIGGTTR